MTIEEQTIDYSTGQELYGQTISRMSLHLSQFDICLSTNSFVSSLNKFST